MAGQDLRYALRGLLHRPGFAAVAVLTIGLGIGANVAIFSVINAVLLRPLPYPDADRLVRVRGSVVATRQPGNLSPMDFLDLQARARTFERLAAYNNYADATLTGAGEPERITGTRVTADFFSALQVAPLLGRDFRPEDDVPGASAVAILSHGFWARRFGADPSVVGRTIHLNSVATEVIGVMPAAFRHPFPDNALQPDAFVPFRLDPKEGNRGGHYLQAIGRLKPGMSLADGQADLSTIAADLEHEYPSTNTGRTVTIARLLDSMVGESRTPLLILLGSVVLVLLIACVNLANLLLARSTSRQREIAIRQALGASRARLVRQFLVESVVLSLAGGVCGLLFAASTLRALTVLGVGRLPRGDSVSIDVRVLLFALALSIVTGLVFGTGPALFATRGGGCDALAQGARTSDGPFHRRAQDALVAVELALALTLLVSAGLLMKSLWLLQHVDPGFQADHVLALTTSLPLARYPEGDEIPFYQRTEERLAALPGVRSIGAINILPLSGNYSCDGFDIEGRPPSAPGQQPCAESRSITPGYFAAMRIPLLRGRTFTRADTERSPAVMIVSDSMARRFWPDRNPLGSRVLYQRTAREVVGVVADVKHFGLDRDAPFEMYTPHAQQPSYHSMTWVMRTPADASSLMPMIRRELWAVDRDVPISNVRTMEQMVGESTMSPRFRTTLIGMFAAVAMILSIVGVSGIIAYAVGRRTREIGIRIALGATRRRVVGMIVVQGMTPAGIGVCVGAAGAVALTRVLSGLLYGVSTTDAGVFSAAVALLLSAALAATYVPARRATTIDPVGALRMD